MSKSIIPIETIKRQVPLWNLPMIWVFPSSGSITLQQKWSNDRDPTDKQYTIMINQFHMAEVG